MFSLEFCLRRGVYAFDSVCNGRIIIIIIIIIPMQAYAWRTHQKVVDGIRQKFPIFS